MKSQNTNQSPSTFKRRLKRLLKVLLIPIVLFIAFLLFERIRGQISLASYERELVGKGEKLEINLLAAPPIPDSKNGADEFLKLSAAIQGGKILPLRPPACMELHDNCLKPLVGFRESYWMSHESSWSNRMSWEVTNSWQDVETELSTNRIALADLRVVLQSRGFDNKLDYATGSEMLLPHLRPTRNLSRWYVASVQLSLRQGNNAEALMDMLASLRLTRVPENDRLVVCELTRIQIANQNAAVCWEALQSDNWTDGQLAEIQSGWLHTSFLTNMILALKMKRAIYRSDFKRFLNSAGSGSAVGALMFHVTPPWVEMMPDGIEVAFTQRIAPAFWRFAWLKQDEKNLLEAVEALIQTCQSAATNQSKLQVSPLLDQFSEKYLPQECRSTIFPVSELILSGIFAPIGAVFRAETQRSLVLCAIALKRHSLRHGKLPTTLDALVPEFLSSVPVDFMDGKPVKYRLGSDGSFTLYSIGEDGMDDGGDIFPVATYSWRDLWKRRDYVWSAPATSAEIEVARKEKRF